MTAVHSWTEPQVIAMPSTVDERAYELGRYVREKRLDRGMNRPTVSSEIAKLGIDVSADYLAKIEAGTRSLASMSLPKREALRHVLGIRRDDWIEVTGLYSPRGEQPWTLSPDNEPATEPQEPPSVSLDVPPMLWVHRMSDADKPVSVAQPLLRVYPLEGDYLIKNREHLRAFESDTDDVSEHPTLSVRIGDAFLVDTTATKPQPGSVYLILADFPRLAVFTYSGFFSTATRAASTLFQPDDVVVQGEVLEYLRKTTGRKERP